ncbi:MAG: YlxR family protein [Deltaproteobacteria bacterium]|nr:YlxR family protein [Deltaproteobacteria bacterium]
MHKLRRCAGCRQRRPRAELLRFVLPGEALGLPTPDLLGRRAGRGAYTCPRPACIRRAVVQGGFARSFRRSLRHGGETLAEDLAETILGDLARGLVQTIDAEIAKMVADGRARRASSGGEGYVSSGGEGCFSGGEGCGQVSSVLGERESLMIWTGRAFVLPPGRARERVARLVEWMAAFSAADETNR